MRIEEPTSASQHAPMDEHIADALFERAVDLAYDAFGEQSTEDHAEWIYQRLVIHWRWGLGAVGVVTVH